MRRKSEPVAIQRVFIWDVVRPTSTIKEMDCVVLVGPKRTWAETPSGRRHLMGSSAFYTQIAAERAKRGALVKMVANTALARMHQTADVYQHARLQLELYDATGFFTPRKGTARKFN